MDKQSFLENLQDALQRDDALTMDMRLKDVPEWDSLAMMVTLALAKRDFGKTLGLSALKKLQSVDDLYALLTAK
ncbi:MAG: hypothetical protein LBN33_05490 [Desulfovibrio sp.]|jgi:acyl carrier protein|nr:hypothetical protein [Desulfovibrio sp.]